LGTDPNKAILARLGGALTDVGFLDSLVTSGRLDIYIDGLNEVDTETRAAITDYVTARPGANIFLTTQPLERYPGDATLYFLLPLSRPQIVDFLVTREATLPVAAPIRGDPYVSQAKAFVAEKLAESDAQSSLKDEAGPESVHTLVERLSNPCCSEFVTVQRAQTRSPTFGQGRDWSHRDGSHTSDIFFLAVTLLLAVSPAHTQLGVKTFRNSYIEFQIPEAWDCTREEDEFVCQEAGRRTVSIIAIVAAKYIDPLRDNTAVYGSELAKRREWKADDGAVVISSGIRSGTRCYEGKLWQWAHHYQSELRNYHTEYFARIEGNIAALMSVSFHRSVEAEGTAMAATIARRLRMLATPATTEC
jgi:hypothetical protein